MDQNVIAQRAAEEFTEAVWRAAPLGRMTLMEIVARFFEDQAVLRAVESRGRLQFRRAAREVDAAIEQRPENKSANDQSQGLTLKAIAGAA